MKAKKDAPDRMGEITQQLEDGVRKIFESGEFERYLRTMSRFHHYSVNNSILIFMQRPDASLVAGYTSWQKNFQRHVKKGEKGIFILAPCPYKVKKEQEKKDDLTGRPLLDQGGKPLKEVVEITQVSFRPAAVFDISQTEGKELPTIGVKDLQGQVSEYDTLLETLKEISPVPIGFEEISGGSKGYYSLGEQRIAIQADMSQLQTIKTMVHEIAHSKLHAIDKDATPEEKAQRPDQHTREVQAEGVAYVVCQHLGLDTSDYSFSYVASWSTGKELSELKSSLDTIRTASAEIIDAIQHQKERQHEKEKLGMEKDEERYPCVLQALAKRKRRKIVPEAEKKRKNYEAIR